MQLAERLQWYYGEIRQKLTYLISRYCPKAYHRPDHPTRIVEYHINYYYYCYYYYNIPKPNIFTETRTHNFGLGAAFLSCLVSELQKPSSPGIEPGTVFWSCGVCFCNLLVQTNNFDHGTVLLSCLVSELQKPSSSGIELSTIFLKF
jgi:hypothetical protein